MRKRTIPLLRSHTCAFLCWGPLCRSQPSEVKVSESSEESNMLLMCLETDWLSQVVCVRVVGKMLSLERTRWDAPTLLFWLAFSRFLPGSCASPPRGHAPPRPGSRSSPSCDHTKTQQRDIGEKEIQHFHPGVLIWHFLQTTMLVFTTFLTNPRAAARWHHHS